MSINGLAIVVGTLLLQWVEAKRRRGSGRGRQVKRFKQEIKVWEGRVNFLSKSRFSTEFTLLR